MSTNEFSFSAFGTEYTATIWNKVAGKERIYIKENGQDVAVALLDGTGISRTKGAWYSPAEKTAFAAALLAARATVEPLAATAPATAPAAVSTAGMNAEDARKIITHADAKESFGGGYIEEVWNR